MYIQANPFQQQKLNRWFFADMMRENQDWGYILTCIGKDTQPSSGFRWSLILVAVQ